MTSDTLAISKEAKGAASRLATSVKGLGVGDEADVLAKAAGVLQLMSGAMSVASLAGTALGTWNTIQTARATASTAVALSNPALWPNLALALAAAGVTTAVTGTIMASTTIRADLSSPEGRERMLREVAEAMA